MPLLSLVSDLSPGAWTLAVVVALLIGFSKTSIGGLGMLAVALLAVVLPAKDSTGTALLLLLTGDVVAVWLYRRNVDWRLIGRIIPPVLVGIAVGAVFLSWADDLVLRRTIGVILLVLTIAGFWRDKLKPEHKAVAAGYGGLAGFTTMVANAGGPAMNLYLLAARYDKWRFIGTTAWFFFIVNVTKLPISIGLGIVRADTVATALVLVPLVLLGAWAGAIVIKHIDQKWFELLVTGFVALTALYLTFW